MSQSVRTLQFSTSEVELTVQKIVSPLTFELERTALRIFSKLGTELDIDKVRKITEPNF